MPVPKKNRQLFEVFMVAPHRNSHRRCNGRPILVRPVLSCLGAIALSIAVSSFVSPTPQSAAAQPQVTQHQKNALASLSAQERATLSQGQATVSGSEGRFVGRVVVNAPASTTWDVLTDYNNFERFFPHVENSRLLESAGNRRVFEQLNAVRIFPLTSRSRIVIAATENYPRQIDFSLVEGDADALQGLWRIEPVSASQPNQVLVTHQVFVDPEGGAATRNFVLGVYRQVLQDTMGAIKTETEQRARR